MSKIITYIKNKLPIGKREKLLRNTFIAFVIVIAILMSQVYVTFVDIKTFSDELIQLEHINAQTQRLVKLVALEQEYNTLLLYLGDEMKKMLAPTSPNSFNIIASSNDAKIVTSDLVDNWKLLRATIEKDTINVHELYLVSDNFHFKVSELAFLTEHYIDDLLYNLIIFEVHIAIASFFIILLGWYCLLSLKTELNHSKSLNIFASLDVATGLFNRSKCQELFNKKSRATKNNANGIIVFDLNDLKLTNDKYGHNLGDELIFSFANLLQTSAEISAIKPFMGRYGGDEFIVYYDNLEDKSEINQFLTELKMLVENFNFTKLEYQISYAVGYALNEDEEITVKALFDRADEFMYANKKLMKNIEEDKTQFENRENADAISVSKISTETIDIQRAKEINNNRKIVTIVGIISTLIIGVTACTTYITKEYVGGNVLYLSDNTTNAPEDKRIGSPWRNSSIANMLLYRTVFSTDHTFTEISPNLATKFDILDDGLTYQITIGNHNLWSDGTPITIDDIVFSIESFLLSENVNTTILNAFNKIVGADAFVKGKSNSLEGLTVNGNVLTIKLNSNYNLFLQSLTQFVPLPKHILEGQDPKTFTTTIDYFKEPVVSGMYKVYGLNEDGNLVLVRNELNNEAIPHIESVVLVSNYTPLDINYYQTNIISDMVDYRSISGFEEHPVNVHFYRYFVFNMEGAKNQTEPNPIEDLRVRQALMHAIDREYILETIYFNTGNVMSDRDEYENPVFIYPYNPTKARELLVDYGYDFDRPFTIMYYYNDDISHIFLQKVKEYLEDIGLTVNLVKSSGSGELYDERNYDIMLKGLSSFGEYDWYSEYLSTNPNLSKVWGDEGKFDDLVNLLLSTINEDEYEQTLLDLRNLEEELNYRMPLFSLNQYVYIDSKRVELPKDMVFGNGSYRYDVRFAEWKIVKE